MLIDLREASTADKGELWGGGGNSSGHWKFKNIYLIKENETTLYNRCEEIGPFQK